MGQSLDTRAKRIIDAALDLDERERGALVDGACAGDGALATRVRALLAEIEADDGFLGGPGESRGGHASVDELSLDGPGAPPRIGAFTILDRIGEGGFGTVYLAEQTEPVRRRVALKVIKPGMDTRAVVARFEQERQALALMDHPNIAKVLDAGATGAGGGRPYFVMEFVQGRPITEYCDLERLGIRERLALLVQVCRAVQHVHIKGIIHRDIKPSNILTSTQDGRPLARVIDFGIAKATQPAPSEQTFFTEAGQLVGTPEYMSPEQAAGQVDVDTRSDVYSLGVLMYELLAGVTPFDVRALRSAAFDEMKRMIREVDPPGPSVRLGRSRETIAGVAAARRTDPRRLGAMVRGELDWIVMRAMEKDPDRRYDSAGNFAADVERYLAGEPVLATPLGLGYRTRKFVGRHRLAAASAGAILGALVVGLGAAVWQAGVAARERDAARTSAAAALAAKGEAEARRAETEQIAAFQESQLQGLDAERMGRRLREAFLSDAKAGLERAGMPAAEIAERQRQFAAMLDDANPTNIALGALDENIFSRALTAADEQFKDQPLVRARLLQTLADTMRELGMLERATPPQEEALAVRRRILGAEDARTLLSLGNMGELLHARGRLPEAERCLREEVEIRARVFGPDERETLGARSNLGMVLQMQGKHSEAERAFRESLEHYRRALGPDDPDTLQAINNLAGVLVDAGQFAAAEPLFREALEKRRRILGDDHTDTVQSINNLGLVREKLGRVAEAEPLYREALERSRRTRGEDHPDTLLYMGNLGSVLVSQGRLAEAEPLTMEALQRRRRVLGDDSWETMQSIYNMGRLLQAQGKAADAEPYLWESLERRRRVLGDANPSTLQSVSSLGQVLTSLGKRAEAERLLLEAQRALAAADGTGEQPQAACIRDLIALYEAWDQAEPGKGYDAKAADWKSRRAEQ